MLTTRRVAEPGTRAKQAKELYGLAPELIPKAGPIIVLEMLLS